MQITTFSFLSAIGWSSVFIVAAYFLRKKPRFSQSFGIVSMFLLYLFSVGRMFVPVEFTPTVVIKSTTIYPAVIRTMQRLVLSKISLLSFLIALWIVVAAILFIQYVFEYQKAVRHIMDYAKPCGDEVKNALSFIQQNAKRNIPITAYCCMDTDFPFGIGLFHKKILLPCKEYPDYELYCILLHEYTHFLNRDTLVKIMASLFCIIFWWNPVVYFLKKDLEQVLEIKCDLTVIKQFDTDQTSHYLQSIVNSMKNITKPQLIPYASTALVQNGQGIEIKERFHAVMSANAEPKAEPYSKILIIAYTLLIMGSYLFLPQPFFAPPEIPGGFGAENAYLKQVDETRYELFVDNESHGVISEAAAKIYIGGGFPIVMEE